MRVREYVAAVLVLVPLLLSWSPRAAELVISTENTPDHPQAQFLARFAAALSPDLAPHTLVMKHSADAVRGRDEAEALTSGRIAFAAPGLWNLDSHAVDLNTLLLPILMGRRGADLEALVDGRLGATLDDGLMRSLDVVVIGRWLDLGPAHIFTVDKQIRRFSDLRGLRIRYAGGALNEMVLKALGAVPVLVAWPDVPAALKSGRVDGILTTASTVVSGRLWQAGLRYGFLSSSSYSFFIPLASRDIWERLTPTQQGRVRTVWEEAIGAGRLDARFSQARALDQLMAAGVALTAPVPDDLAMTRALLMRKQPDFVQSLGLSPSVVSVLSASIEEGLEP